MPGVTGRRVAGASTPVGADLVGSPAVNRLRAALWANAAWMAFVWVTRIRNALGDDALSTSGQVQAYGLSTLGLGGAAAMAWWARSAKPDGETVSGVPVAGVRGVAAAHAGVWLVLGTAIAMGDRAVGFKVVHGVLAIVSIALAAWAARSVGTASRLGAERAAVGAG